jgi:hypothetical protein
VALLVALCLSPVQAQSPNDGFAPSANGAFFSLAMQANGKILVGGKFGTLGGESVAFIGRLYPDSTLDKTFNPGANAVVNTLAVQGDGKIVVGGGSPHWVGRRAAASGGSTSTARWT